MAVRKLIYIALTHNGRKTIYGGTLEHLLHNVFGYILECGNSCNKKIPRYPKSAKSLVKALNDSTYECNKYNDFYDLSSEEEFENHDGSKSLMELHAMREYLFKGMEYQELVKELVFKNMEICERLAKAMQVLNWRWADASADNGIPNAVKIHDAIIELFEESEHEILGKPTEELMKLDGSYTVKTGGLILRWSWNTKTFKLYDFEVVFDIWDYKI